jgi:hypothetical protein
MDVNQIALRAEEHRIMHECACKIRALIDSVLDEIGTEMQDGDNVEEAIIKLVVD